MRVRTDMDSARTCSERGSSALNAVASRFVALALGVAAAASLCAPVAGAQPAGVQPAGACTTGDGVTVVVDFGALADDAQMRERVLVGCAHGPQTTGLAALTNAGFAWEGTTRFPSFVCRILAKPASADCYDAAPVNATWAYFTAVPGGKWTYSSVGAAGGATAAPGTVQGWAWSTGKNSPPSIAPPLVVPPTTLAPLTAAPSTAAPAPQATPAQSAKPTGGGAAPGASGGSSSPAVPAIPANQGDPTAPQPDPAVPAIGAETPPPDGGAQPDGSGTVPVDTEVLGATTEASPSTIAPDTATLDVAAGEVTITDGASSPVGTIIGAAGVVAASAAAAVMARRRQQR
ncbi:MAG: hypothetical protein GX868_09530 [Actinobacteria bacterium]|nr:hypothetical protein [Actinomycetota bacterium]